MAIIYYVWILVQILIGYNLILPVILFLFYHFLRLFRSAAKREHPQKEYDYAVIITAYQQTALLPSVVNSVLSLNYSNFLVYVVADNCDISTLKFEDNRVVLLRPEEILASNTASHFHAIRNFKRNHTHLTIIDSDNLLDENYLGELNKLFDQGYSAVQGIRKAKNLDTTYACLDAARDIYYHFYDGRILFGSRSSATLSGSAMAFDITLYRECLENLEIRGAGFDKVLQFEIVKRGLRIAFTEHAIVYDEKTSQSTQLVKQRARWINTWFKYFRFGFSLLGRGISGFNFNQSLFGVVLLRPPLFIFLILSVICLTINLWIDLTAVFLWLAALITFVTGFVIALISSETPQKIYKALINIPKFMFFQVVSLMNVKSANKISVATEHYHADINNEVQSKNIHSKN